MPPLLLIKALLFLVFVILLIYACFLLAQKRAKKQVVAQQIKIIEHRRIDQKLTVSLIAINDEYLVLAAGPNGIAFEKLSQTKTP